VSALNPDAITLARALATQFANAAPSTDRDDDIDSDEDIELQLRSRTFRDAFESRRRGQKKGGA
jgi:hypothetical protein